MFDPAWLSQEAETLHATFNGLFFATVTLLLLVGIFTEYFKWPLGGVPAFGVLVGRALVATIILYSYSEITNLLADLSDSLATRLGDLNEFQLVLSKMGDKLGEFSASWVSVKETITMALSFLGFFLLYFSVYVAQGIYLFTWTLCYVFSPFLIALYVLPATAGTTKALFRTLFEVSTWKICWSCLATLLWSMALGELGKQDINFIAVLCMNLLLAASLLATPLVVHSLASSGLSGFNQTLGGIAVGAATLSPGRVVGAVKSGMHRTTQGVSRLAKGRPTKSGGNDELSKKLKRR